MHAGILCLIGFRLYDFLFTAINLFFHAALISVDKILFSAQTTKWEMLFFFNNDKMFKLLFVFVVSLAWNNFYTYIIYSILL